MIREATVQDVPALLAIWNPIIAGTTVTFSPSEHDAAGLAALIAARQAAGRAFLVAESAGAVAGFASYDQFRKGLGYAQSMEHTVILGPQARGRGLGRALMTAICEHATARGARLMVGAVSGENGAGIAFHRAIGFREAGRLSDAGRKFDRWIDLVLMEKRL